MLALGSESGQAHVILENVILASFNGNTVENLPCFQFICSIVFPIISMMIRAGPIVLFCYFIYLLLF